MSEELLSLIHSTILHVNQAILDLGVISRVNDQKFNEASFKEYKELLDGVLSGLHKMYKEVKLK